jgi:hypothetical protein
MTPKGNCQTLTHHPSKGGVVGFYRAVRVRLKQRTTGDERGRRRRRLWLGAVTVSGDNHSTTLPGGARIFRADNGSET